jgi:hypothetical protein
MYKNKYHVRGFNKAEAMGLVSDLKNFMLHKNETIESRHTFFVLHDINEGIFGDMLDKYKEPKLEYQNCLNIEKTRLIKAMVESPANCEACKLLLVAYHGLNVSTDKDNILKAIVGDSSAA